jgi:hypothetical protein
MEKPFEHDRDRRAAAVHHRRLKSFPVGLYISSESAIITAPDATYRTN